MKKLSVLVLTLALTIVLGGCLKKNTVETPTADAPQAEDNAPAGGLQVLDRSLRNWLTGSSGVECSVESPEGQVVIQSKGDKVLISGIAYTDMKTGETSSQGNSLTTVDWMYMWSGQDGMKMNLVKLDEINRQLSSSSEPEQKTWQEDVDEWQTDNTDYTCEEKNLPDSTFEPPADVNFTDLTSLMEGMTQLGQQLEGNMATDSAPDLDALKKMSDDLQKQIDSGALNNMAVPAE